MVTPGAVVVARPLNSSEDSNKLSERMMMSTHDLVSPTWNSKLVGGGEKSELAAREDSVN